MPESTLRRHIAALVKAGVILRHDSPNGKRYATRGSESRPAHAFGFDLGPLARRAVEFRCMVDECRRADDQLRQLREFVTLRLRDAIQLGGMDVLALTEMKKALRRKLSHVELEQIAERLNQFLTLDEPEEVSGNDNQNERHIQEDNKVTIKKNVRAPVIPDFSRVLESCTEFASFYPVKSWRDFIHAAEQLRPMIGIDAHSWQQACEAMAPECAAATIACILQRLKSIHRPSSYLRMLAEKALNGTFSLERMVRGLSRSAIMEG